MSGGTRLAGVLAKIQVAMGLNVDKASMAQAVLPVLATMNVGRSVSKTLLIFVPVAGNVINGGVAATMTGALGEAYTQACALALRQVNDRTGGCRRPRRSRLSSPSSVPASGASSDPDPELRV